MSNETRQVEIGQITDEIELTTRQYPTIEEFLRTVPILQYDIEGYITDTRGQKDWGADAIADFSSRLGIATKSVESEIIGADEAGQGGEWKIHAEVEFIDTGCTEIAEITQPRMTTKTDFKTKEQYEEDDPFGLEKAVARAVRNAKKRAFPAKRLLQMLFDARKARDDARSELRKQMGAYKEAEISPRELIFCAEQLFEKDQDSWQAKDWDWFKEGITDGATAGTGLFFDLLEKAKNESDDEAQPDLEKVNETQATSSSDVNAEELEIVDESAESDSTTDSTTAAAGSIPEDYE